MKDDENVPFVPENPDVMPTDEEVPTPFVPENPDMMPTEGEASTAQGDFRTEEWYRIALAKSMMNVGNNKRLKAVIEKAQAGEEITIASIGGSITEGAGAVKYKECYAYQTFDKFKTVYGSGDGTNVHFVNAGVGGTPSPFGWLRYQRDIVSRVNDADGLPDIVMIEYSVNDYQEPTKHQCFESMVKEILMQPNNPVVIIVFAVFPDGFTLQEEMKKVGFAYDCMMVSTKNGPYALVGDKWTKEEFFFDIYHPTTLGHGIMADCIFNTIQTAAEKETDSEDINLDVASVYGTNYMGMKTIFKDDYEEEINLQVGGFNQDDAKSYHNLPIGGVYDKNFHHTKDSGSESLTFTVSCKNLLLAFRSVNDASFGSIDVYVDGEKRRTIKGNTGSWGQSVTDLIFSEEEAKLHTIEIRMMEGDEEKKFTITCMGYTE